MKRHLLPNTFTLCASLPFSSTRVHTVMYVTSLCFGLTPILLSLSVLSAPMDHNIDAGSSSKGKQHIVESPPWHYPFKVDFDFPPGEDYTTSSHLGYYGSNGATDRYNDVPLEDFQDLDMSWTQEAPNNPHKQVHASSSLVDQQHDIDGSMLPLKEGEDESTIIYEVDVPENDVFTRFEFTRELTPKELKIARKIARDNEPGSLSNKERSVKRSRLRSKGLPLKYRIQKSLSRWTQGEISALKAKLTVLPPRPTKSSLLPGVHEEALRNHYIPSSIVQTLSQEHQNLLANMYQEFPLDKPLPPVRSAKRRQFYRLHKSLKEMGIPLPALKSGRPLTIESGATLNMEIKRLRDHEKRHKGSDLATR